MKFEYYTGEGNLITFKVPKKRLPVLYLHIEENVFVNTTLDKPIDLSNFMKSSRAQKHIPFKIVSRPYVDEENMLGDQTQLELTRFVKYVRVKIACKVASELLREPSLWYVHK